MFDNYKNSPDSRFLADIRTIAENTTATAHSLAVIAGILAKREGIPCTDPSLVQPTQPTTSAHKNVTAQSPSNNDTDHRDELQQLEESIADAYRQFPQDPEPRPHSIW